MIRLSSPFQLQKQILLLKKRGRSIALVPTMGFLHAGHLSLIQIAKKKADVVVVSLFVNPLQFGKNEDYAIYPKNLKADLQKLQKMGVDFVLTPTVSQMYPQNFATQVRLPSLSDDLCGQSRPGHFDGVATVVLKLFQIVQPDFAVFGRKDYQQLFLIKAMTRDLNLPIKILSGPIVRERDGLAMSSRNVRLQPEERLWALGLSRGLRRAKERVRQKGVTLALLEQIIRAEIPRHPAVKIDYLAFRDATTLQKISQYKRGRTLAALAVQVGSVRLIDNAVL